MLLFLEHKNSETAMKLLMRNVGMTLHAVHKLRAQGLDNVKVNMDWQHLLMNGESLGEYGRRCSRPKGFSVISTRIPAGGRSTTTTWSARRRSSIARARHRAPARRLRPKRRAPRVRPLPVHGGRDRSGEAKRSPVALHRLDRGANRRRGSARGADGEGRRPGVRARIRALGA